MLKQEETMATGPQQGVPKGQLSLILSLSLSLSLSFAVFSLCCDAFPLHFTILLSFSFLACLLFFFPTFLRSV